MYLKIQQISTKLHNVSDRGGENHQNYQHNQEKSPLDPCCIPEEIQNDNISFINILHQTCFSPITSAPESYSCSAWTHRDSWRAAWFIKNGHSQL